MYCSKLSLRILIPIVSNIFLTSCLTTNSMMGAPKMKTKTLGHLAFCAMVGTGCATQSSNDFQAFQPASLESQLKSAQLTQKTQNFFVISDTSGSMSQHFTGSIGYDKATKLDVEKNLISRFNLTIPAIPLQSGLRSFGFGPCADWQFTVLKQPFSAYSTNQFDQTIRSLECSSGGTPLADALRDSATDLNSAKDNIALIIFSDGNDEGDPIQAAAELKEKFGDRLCIHTVWVGNSSDVAGKEQLDEIADLSGCGIATTATQINSPDGMKEFVKNVFFKPVVNTDEDHDGVIDQKDKCPGTPKGAIVDENGCWTFRDILFDFDRSVIKSVYHPVINNAVDVLSQNPGLRIEIEGHTDSQGSDAYNLKLSEKRAKAVKEALIQRGIEGDRLISKGYGETQPVDTNDTAAGRANNRRVVYVPR
jgi:OmpA-OmpF porin, OOP family